MSILRGLGRGWFGGLEVNKRRTKCTDKVKGLGGRLDEPDNDDGEVGGMDLCLRAPDTKCVGRGWERGALGMNCVDPWQIGPG